MPPSLSLRNSLSAYRNGALLDSDATTFIAASGATDTKAVNDFVKGVKTLGLWSNMVCWPLRSAQNAGAGATAYSLGGLGTYNGTLVSSPAWGADGITFTAASTQYVTTGFRFPSGPLWAFADIKFANTSANYAIITKDDQGSNRDWSVLYSNTTTRVRLDANIGSGYGNNRVNLPSSQTTDRQIVQFSHDGTNYNARRNKETRQTASGTGTITDANVNIRIGAFGNNSMPLNGLIGSVMLFNVGPSATQETDLYDLYATTLGAGLGLP